MRESNKKAWAAWYYEWRAKLLKEYREQWAKESPEYLAEIEQCQRDYEKGES